MDTITANQEMEARYEGRRTDSALDAIPVARPDRHIWGIYIVLCILSLVELYSASSREVASSAIGVYGPLLRHGVMLLAGLGIILFLQRIHYRKFLVWIPAFAMISVVMMVYVIFFGDVVNGARRSFRLLGITMQPSEFIKISAAAMIALVLSVSQMQGAAKRSGVGVSAFMVLIFAGMLLPQGLTNTVLLMAISVSMMIVGAAKWKDLGIVGLIYIVGAAVFLLVDAACGGEILGRMGVWVARFTQHAGGDVPMYDMAIDSSNAQEMYSYMAQAHGGVTGVLPGNSRETARLPLAFSDYIYAIIVEDLGMVGGVFVMMLYVWLLGRASAIASRCSRAFPALLVIGMALTIAYQAFCHIAIVTGFSPVSGQPLPLISKGGTSILVTSIAFGVMLSVSRYAVRSGRRKEIKAELEALPEEARAENPSQLV
ncbi:MAG: FtsW/RodA/SpoVE family cell cycle protein [Muribaculaceae bacterium]|nr:FtsW/RodA/SpoVE family cell cycle protein [Muribaculaceae bacterium]